MSKDDELKALQEENQKLKNLLKHGQELPIADAIPALISYMDKDLRYTYVNKTYEKWFNIKPESLIGKTVREFVGDDVYSKVYPFFKRALDGEIVSFEQESKYPSGTKHIHVVYTPDKDQTTGEVKGVIALVNDISERVAIQKAEKAQFHKLTSLFEEAPIGMALLEGPNHTFITANKNFRDYFVSGEFTNKTVDEVLPAARSQGFVTLLDDVYKTGMPYIGKETKFEMTKNGKSATYFLNFIYQAVHDPNGQITGILAVISDVTELVLAKNELIEERDIRERFVSTLTHDLTTPLTAAKLSTQLVLRKLNDPTSLQTLANRIMSSLNRAEKMVRDLLDANMINAGEGIPINKRACELNMVIDEAMLDLISLHGNRFKFIRKNAQIQGFWDPEALQRIVENLVNNAVKYGDSNSPITITTDTDTKQAILKVHNFGNAISNQDQRTLFDSYKRLDAAKISSKTGWGIGLSLVKGISEAHNGSAAVESSVEKGTTFTIKLPLEG